MKKLDKGWGGGKVASKMRGKGSIGQKVKMWCERYYKMKKKMDEGGKLARGEILAKM